MWSAKIFTLYPEFFPGILDIGLYKSRACSPPQPLTSMRSPGRTCTASWVSRSTTSSRASPLLIWNSGVPADTTRSLFSNTRCTVPAAGASTSRMPASAWLPKRCERALSRSAAAACRAARALASRACAAAAIWA